MSKFSGVVGFVRSVEKVPGEGVWIPEITEEAYIGDFIRNARGWSESQEVNGNLRYNSRISIVADPFLYQNFMYIRFVRYDGGSWEITNVEFQRPRLILTMGGVYNG